MYEFFYNATKEQHNRNYGGMLRGLEDLGYLYGLRKDYKSAKEQLEKDIESKADTAEMTAAKKNIPIARSQVAEKTERLQSLESLEEQKIALEQRVAELKQKIENVGNDLAEESGDEE